MIGKAAAREPVLPVMRGPDQASIGVLVGERRVVVTPRQRAEARLALFDERPRARTLESEPHIGGELQLEVDAVGNGYALVVAMLRVLPACPMQAVVEGRLAVEDQLDCPVHTADRAQQDVLGLVVGRRPAVGPRNRRVVVPRADQEHVADDDPAAIGAPARLEDHRAWQIAPRRWHRQIGGTEPEPARATVEDGAEHAGRVHPRQAHPLDVAAGGNESGYLTVGQKAVVGDGRKWRDARPVLDAEIRFEARIVTLGSACVAVCRRPFGKDDIVFVD